MADVVNHDWEAIKAIEADLRKSGVTHIHPIQGDKVVVSLGWSDDRALIALVFSDGMYAACNLYRSEPLEADTTHCPTPEGNAFRDRVANEYVARLEPS